MSDRLEGVYGIIPTPAKEGADRWDAVDTVDLSETERLVERMIADGVAGFIALGTTGESATLRPDEYRQVADCVVSTVAARVPTFIGATALGLHEVVDRVRFVRDLGAQGALVGLPMWQPLTHEMAVSYYARLSEAFPQLPVMVYANQRAFRFAFDAAFWSAVSAAAPTVRSAKFSNPAKLLEFEAAAGQVQFLPHETALHRFYELSPERTTACWSTAASMGPEPALAIMGAIRDGADERARAIAADLDHAMEPIDALVANPEVFASYNIQIEKARMDAAGYCTAGPCRPPYDSLPGEYAEAAAENARRWVELRQRYAA
jgi:dihydrodipicolinate synthase/N-acetylneuraminate lyase